MAMIEQRVEVVEERIDRLEALFGQFMTRTGIALQRIDRAIERIEAAGADEREENAKAREENAKAREEAARDREEAARERRAMNKRWGELANKQGTIVEDIIAPSLRRMAWAELNCGEERFFAERISRTRSDDPSRRREFDALYVGVRAVLLNETKSTARPEDARTFVEFLRREEFALYFPEYAAMPVTPVFSSLQLPVDLVTYLSRNGVYAVAMGDEAMQVLNLEQVRSQQ